MATDPCGYCVSVEIRTTAAEDTQPTLQRSWSYGTGRLCVTTAVAFARLDGTDPVPSAYPPGLEKDRASDSARANLLARRLFDACPEADVVDVQLWRPHRKPQPLPGTDVNNGHRTLSAGALLREREDWLCSLPTGSGTDLGERSRRVTQVGRHLMLRSSGGCGPRFILRAGRRMPR